MTPYRLIEEAKSRAVERGDHFVETPFDIVAKIEERSGKEVYCNGFRDYHGPRKESLDPDR